MASVKLKWGLVRVTELLAMAHFSAVVLQLCKWKSKLEMSSPLVPKTIHESLDYSLEGVRVPKSSGILKEWYHLQFEKDFGSLHISFKGSA